MTTALLIIDVQQALSSGAYAAFEVDRLIDTINAVAATARQAGAPVIVIQHEDEEAPMLFGSPGWQLADGLVVSPTDLRVRKTTPDSFHQTGLQALLDERGAARLVVCGMQSDFCVNATVRRALILGYEVALVEDGHTTVDNGGVSAARITADHNDAFRQLAVAGSRIALMPASQVQSQHVFN